MNQDQRIRECIALWEGTPLVKEPIWPTPWPEEGRPDLARDYSASILYFAMRVYLNGEENFYDEACDALYENAHYYRTHLNVRNDRDSYYWALGEQVRLIWHYGRYGDRVPGLLRADAEMEMLAMMSEYSRDLYKKDTYDWQTTNTWRIHESENHHMQQVTTFWMQAVLLDKYPEFRNVEYADGGTGKDAIPGMEEYILHWIQERAVKSLFVEIASACYTSPMLKNVYAFYDLGSNALLKEKTRALLDLFWATWAQEQLGGVRGGGQARVYHINQINGVSNGDLWFYAYFGYGRPVMPIENDYIILDSNYRVPAMIEKMAHETEERGAYEIWSRPLGLADTQKNGFPHYWPRQDWGGIVRYSYCTPDYILGTLMTHRDGNFDWNGEWMGISAQNRTQGAIFAAHPDARIQLIPLAMAHGGSAPSVTTTCYNAWVSAQREGTLITMAMPEAKTCAGGYMSVWFSEAGGVSGSLEEKDGWLFAQSGNAYAALYVIGPWHMKNPTIEGLKRHQRTVAIDTCGRAPWWRGARLHCDSRDCVIVMETGDADQFGSYEGFVSAVLDNDAPVAEENHVIYRSLYGHEFDFSTEDDGVNRIDGEDCAAPIPWSYKSPYVNGLWNDPYVEVEYDGEKLALDFSL